MTTGAATILEIMILPAARMGDPTGMTHPEVGLVPMIVTVQAVPIVIINWNAAIPSSMTEMDPAVIVPIPKTFSLWINWIDPMSGIHHAIA